MLDRRSIKPMAFLCALLALTAAIGAFVLFEHQYCMDVPLISQKKVHQYTNVSNLDISQLRFNGEKVAADISTSTVYIFQSSGNLLHYSVLQGKIASTNSNQTLFFLKNSALEDISSAVQNGTPLTLVIVEGSLCQSVNVVISTLPILNIDGTQTNINDDGRPVFSGYATLWSGFDPSTEAYSITSSHLQWHLRGNSTSTQAKKPWKLSFKDNEGKNKNIDLLGLGKDDDWILNSLTMDDTRIREKLLMDLWNTIAAEADHNYKMSSGEYVEVVINGEYLGLFLLQRRLDSKYLELSDEDVLLKATTYQATCAEEAYEFVTPAVNTQEIYAIMQNVFERNVPSSYNVHNVIDVNLLLQISNARDNNSLKNMYHLLKKTNDGYEHYLVPWDTDQSFGLVWKANVGFAYDYQQALREFDVRTETYALRKTYSNYQEQASERWDYLHRTTFSEDHIISHIDQLYDQLTVSGAFARDVSKWSNRYGEEDTIEALKDYVRARLVFVNEQYQ